MDNIHQFNSKKEQFLMQACQGLDEIKAGIERGDLQCYFAVAYSKEQGAVIFYSKPEEISYYHILGQVELGKQYLIDILSGAVIID